MQTNHARLVYLDPLRTSLTLTLVGFLMSIPLIAIMKFFRQFDTPSRHVGVGWLTLVMAAVLFTLLSFVVSICGALAFNAVARVTGGVPYRAGKSVEPAERSLADGGV